MATQKTCVVLPFQWTEGDTLPQLPLVVPDEDITGWTITLQLRRPSDVIEKTATITDGPTGQFVFSWAATDLVAGQRQLATVRLVNLAGDVETLRFFINVETRLEATP